MIWADSPINSAKIKVFALPNFPKMMLVKKAAEMKPTALVTKTRDMMAYEIW